MVAETIQVKLQLPQNIASRGCYSNRLLVTEHLNLKTSHVAAHTLKQLCRVGRGVTWILIVGVNDADGSISDVHPHADRWHPVGTTVHQKLMVAHQYSLFIEERLCYLKETAPKW